MCLFRKKPDRPQTAAEMHPVWSRNLPGELLELWPKSTSGQPEAPAFLQHCSCMNIADEMLINRLRSFGIPAVKQYPANGGFDTVLFGMSNEGTDIYVPASMLEDAKALLTEEEP